MDKQDVVMHIKLPKELLRKLDHWAIERDMYRNAAVCELLAGALKDFEWPSSRAAIPRP